MQDVWKVSTRPLGWTDRGGSFLVGLWGVLWALYLVAACTSWYFGSPYSGGAQDSVFSIEINVIASAVYVGLCLASAAIIFSITKQAEKARGD